MSTYFCLASEDKLLMQLFWLSQGIDTETAYFQHDAIFGGPTKHVNKVYYISTFNYISYYWCNTYHLAEYKNMGFSTELNKELDLEVLSMQISKSVLIKLYIILKKKKNQPSILINKCRSLPQYFSFST